MLAIITHVGTSLIDPSSFKHSSSSFPTSTSLECSACSWSVDNSQLYLVNSLSIKRYTTSECLLEELYRAPDTVTSLAIKDVNSILFFASANQVWSLDCTHSPGNVLYSLEPHESTVTSVSISNDGTLLASVSASAVFVHNLTLSSHVQLRGLPDSKPVTCCLFHQHSTSRLLLGVGRDVIVYDSTRPSGPLKTVRVPGGGRIVGIAASPFSKTLLAVATSIGDAALIDLDKDNGILKTVNVKSSLTCCAFTTEGAAIYLGTEDGKLLILDLRLLEKEPKSYTIGDNEAPIKAIVVPQKTKSHDTETTRPKTKSRLSAVAKSSPQRPALSRQTASTASVITSPGIELPVRVMVASKIRGGGGVTPKKKLFSPVRTPLSNTNLELDAHLAASRSPTLKPLRVPTKKEQAGNWETQAKPSMASSSSGSAEMPTHSRRNSHHKTGLGPVPESISGHLTTTRIHSVPASNGTTRNEYDRIKTVTRRIISESVEKAATGGRPASTASMRNKTSSKFAQSITRPQQKQEPRSTTPDNGDDRLGLTSPELPREPVTPILLSKKAVKFPLASATNSDVLGITSPEVVTRAQRERAKGKEKAEVKRTRFTQAADTKVSTRRSDELEDEDGPEILAGEGQDDGRENLPLQVSPCRANVPPTWLQSPHRPSTANVNMNAAAQEFLRGIVHDVMYDFHRETKTEMMNLHLDLVRMGRGWKQELRDIMEEWKGEIQELRAENRQLKEENARLRRDQ